MKKVIFLFLITFSFQSKACGPYVSGTMINPLFSSGGTIYNNQLFMFSTYHYSDKFKNYGKYYKMYLQDTTSKEKVNLIEDNTSLLGSTRDQYLGLKAEKNLSTNSVYMFVIEVEGKEIEWFSSEIYCNVTHRPFHVIDKPQDQPALVSIKKLNRYKDEVVSATFNGMPNRLYKITINVPGEESKAHFIYNYYNSIHVELRDISDDTNINITLVSIDGEMQLTQYYKAGSIKKWTEPNNS